MKIKFDISYIIITVIVLLSFSQIAYGQVNVSLPDTSISKEKEIIIPINVSDLTDLNIRSYELKISFDPDIVRVKSISDKNTLTDINTWGYRESLRRSSVSVSANGWLPLKSSGSLINIIFEVVSDKGFTNLEFENFEFNYGVPKVKLKNGTISIVNSKSISFIKTGQGDGEISINNAVYGFPQSIEFNIGDEITIEAIPNTNSEFLEWKGDINTSELNYTFIVENQNEIICEFDLKQFSVELITSTTEAGTLEGEGSYSFGETCEISVTDNYGWDFVSWKMDGSYYTDKRDFQFEVEKDVIFEAQFEKEIFNLSTVSLPAEGGNINGAGYYYYLDNVELYAEPEIGWEFSNWELAGNVIGSEPILYFNVNNNSTVTANFTRKLYNIEVNISPINSGTVSGSGYFYYDQNAELIASANPGWEFSHWSKNDSVVSTDTTLTIFVFENHNYTANFKNLSDITGLEIDNFNWKFNTPYPNPFNPKTTFNFSIKNSSKVSLLIFDVTGRLVDRIIDDQFFTSGTYNQEFFAEELSSGIYFYKFLIIEEISNKSFSRSGKLILLK